jgi:hypothetical protein
MPHSLTRRAFLHHCATDMSILRAWEGPRCSAACLTDLICAVHRDLNTTRGLLLFPVVPASAAFAVQS